MSVLDKMPLTILVLLALTLGLAPFVPEPHLWEKLKMLAAARWGNRSTSSTFFCTPHPSLRWR